MIFFFPLEGEFSAGSTTQVSNEGLTMKKMQNILIKPQIFE